MLNSLDATHPNGKVHTEERLRSADRHAEGQESQQSEGSSDVKQRDSEPKPEQHAHTVQTLEPREVMYGDSRTDSAEAEFLGLE